MPLTKSSFSQALLRKKIEDYKHKMEFTVLKDSQQAKHGYYKMYDLFSLTTTEGFYKHGLKDSLWHITRNKILTSTGSYKNDVATGVWKNYRINKKSGCLIDSGEYSNGKKINEWAYFDQCSPELKYNYSLKKLIYHLPDSTFYSIISGSDTLLVVPENPPLHPEGKANFRKKIEMNLRFPREFMTSKNFTRKVTLSFWITESGAVEELTIIKKSEEPFDREALRVFQQFEKDSWIPAVYNGKPVKSRIILPITFSYEGIINMND